MADETSVWPFVGALAVAGVLVVGSWLTFGYVVGKGLKWSGAMK